MSRPLLLVFCLSLLFLTACEETEEPSAAPAPVYSAAGQCFTVAWVEPDRSLAGALTVTSDGAGYTFAALRPQDGEPFFFKASGLGTYLLRDASGQHLVSDGSGLARQGALLSDVLLADDTFESGATWALEAVGQGRDRTLRLRHLKSGRYVANQTLVTNVDDAAALQLVGSDDCAPFPEASLDADGRVTQTAFEDGSLYGIVDTHSHILSNFAFGGGGIFHGSPFHPLGVEHALADCATYHGTEGRKDLFGFGFDARGGDSSAVLTAFLLGQTPTANHATAGWPTFTDWPNAPGSSTHQVQYYRWLERAYLGGLRLVVQHATTNQIICDLIKGGNVQTTRYDCNDMVAVDRILDESYAMQDYIDAQEGGPGKGWFRIVTSPEAARSAIADGKLAVILGIETSNLFDCFLVPRAPFQACSPADVLAKLDHYYDRGVRAMFPVHKYDNGFSAGDGDKEFIEVGNFIQTGHFANFTTDCDPSIPTTFDNGTVSFSALNQPRVDYAAAPPNDTSGFATNPIGTLVPFLGLISSPPGTEQVCQNAGLTDLGRLLIDEMMRRGMIIELDHLPRRSYAEAFSTLQQYDYPAAGTHGLNGGGALYAIGGVSKSGFGRCQSASASATMDDGFQSRIQLITDNGGFPAEGFGFDLNGFAGAPGPRFGPNSGCSAPQTDPVTYPFTSVAGDVVFDTPSVGNRVLDFNTEGLVHIGLLPELIEDVRNDGVTDQELEPLFKSAEGYVRMWEKAEQRASERAARG